MSEFSLTIGLSTEELKTRIKQLHEKIGMLSVEESILRVEVNKYDLEDTLKLETIYHTLIDLKNDLSIYEEYVNDIDTERRWARDYPESVVLYNSDSRLDFLNVQANLKLESVFMREMQLENMGLDTDNRESIIREFESFHLLKENYVKIRTSIQIAQDFIDSYQMELEKHGK